MSEGRNCIVQIDDSAFSRWLRLIYSREQTYGSDSALKFATIQGKLQNRGLRESAPNCMNRNHREDLVLYVISTEKGVACYPLPLAFSPNCNVVTLGLSNSAHIERKSRPPGCAPRANWTEDDRVKVTKNTP